MVEPAERTSALQGCLADLLLDQDGHSLFGADPAAFGAARQLHMEDQAALAHYKSRLLTYRSLVRSALEDPLPDCFPFTHALLEKAGQWAACVDAFLGSRSIQSSYYRDVNPAFVAWLAQSGWGQDRWPFLLQLAHYEYIEVEILRWPDEAPQVDLGALPKADLYVVFDGTVRNLAYAYAVQDASGGNPEPDAGETYLLAYRDGAGDFQASTLSPHASAFLARCLEGERVGEAARALGLPLEDGLELLWSLHAKGAVLGFR